MSKKLCVLQVLLLLAIFMVGCASEEVKETAQEAKLVSCKLNQKDGECRYYSDGSAFCSMGSCTNGDCENGQGKLEFPGGSKREGVFKKGLLEGQGILANCEDSGTFEGILKNGSPENGSIKYANGSSYKGQLKNGLFEGKGLYIESGGNTYEGNWSKGKKNGIFSVVLNSESKKITYKEDEDVIEIARRKKEEAEERRRIAAEEAERRSRCAGARSKVIRILDGWNPGSAWACKNQVTNRDHMYSILSYGVSAYERLCNCL